MSDKFSFSVELQETNNVAVYQSEMGDDYYVNYVVNKNGEIVLNIEWLNKRRNLVKVELFSPDSNLISSQMRLGDEKHVCFKFMAKQDDAKQCSLMFIITVIPHVDVKDKPTSSKDIGELTNENDEKVKELSDDLLIGLAMDMRDLFIHGDLSDAVITNGDHALKVHAAILSARSPVFRKALRDPLHEKVILIPGVSAKALEDMIVFIYSSFIKIKDMDRAEELYVLANEYGIEDLHEVCSIYMSNCTIDHSLKTLILADKYQDMPLKKASIDFILKNLCEIKSSGKWESFTEDNIDLVSEIFSRVSGVSERDCLQAFISRISVKKSNF